MLFFDGIRHFDLFRTMLNRLSYTMCQGITGKTVGKDITDFDFDRSFSDNKFQFCINFRKEEKFPDTAAAADSS